MNDQNETLSAGKPWPRETIRALKVVEDFRSHQLNPAILNRLKADGLICLVQYYKITERGDEVLHGQKCR